MQRVSIEVLEQARWDHEDCDPGLVEQLLERIAQEGLSVDEGEYLDGLISLAIPVFDEHQRICFAIAVHAPTARRSLVELRQYIPALRRAAGKLSGVVQGEE